jgi:hypothetical protein
MIKITEKPFRALNYHIPVSLILGSKPSLDRLFSLLLYPGKRF